MHVEFLKSFSKYAVNDRVPFVFFFIQDGHLTDNEQNVEPQQILGVTTSKNGNKGYKCDGQTILVYSSLICANARTENCVEWRGVSTKAH